MGESFVKKAAQKTFALWPCGVGTTNAPPHHPTVMPAQAGIHDFLKTEAQAMSHRPGQLA
jgi:hypothetical protein